MWVGEVIFTAIYYPTITKLEELAETYPSLDLIFVVGIDEVRPWTGPKHGTPEAVALRSKPCRQEHEFLPERTTDKHFAPMHFLTRCQRRCTAPHTIAMCYGLGASQRKVTVAVRRKPNPTRSAVVSVRFRPLRLLRYPLPPIVKPQ
ncbi:hypothetical protein F5I97DRAFT_345069 [Phlebopus sp. FC_14]|nr:hypothetical protein F5I97DRAFT_345069 [Phlebopus sp. FC_14]